MYRSFTLYSDEVGGIGTPRQAHFGCGGENISPRLLWVNPPSGTKSFALTIHDKDAPTDGGFWHWVIYNIPADVKELVSGAGDITKKLAPKGSLQSVTDYGTLGYGGPNPPAGHGWHSYLCTLYALDVEHLELPETTPASQIAFNVWAHTIEKCSIVFYYKNE